MTTTLHRSAKNLVVVQLSGGNDYLNTVVPYSDGLYYDYRPAVGIPAEGLLPLDERVAFPTSMAPIKRMWDQGKVAVIMGIGYPNHSRSHFRSMDIWHTANPDTFDMEGWLGKTVGALDPTGRNPITAVSFGRGLPRALACPDVAAASVGQLESYGLFTGIPGAHARDPLLDVAKRVYSPQASAQFVSRRLLGTGMAAQEGADMLRTASANYTSTVDYPARHPYYPVSEHLQGVAAVMAADLGTRVYYTMHGSFDTHGDEVVNHARLWDRLSISLDAFFTDLDQHGVRKDTVVLLFSEFGRRIKDNNGGTDHGAGGVAMLIGDSVRGGLYGDYPSLAPADQDEGDVRTTTDFRALYASILEQFLDVDPAVAVAGAGSYQQLPLRRS
ncbi:MAG: DUF1501 domain-containing protein [Pseudonocardiaceae bacterium]